MKRVLALIALCVITLTWPCHAADRPRVVLVGTPDLEHALVVALEPWDVEVARADDAPPYTEDRAAVIAEAHNGAALVWATGTSLWVYDARTRQMVSRALLHLPPLDPPAASAAALTIKTMLRSTPVAPPAERLDGAPPIGSALPSIPPSKLPPIPKSPPPSPVLFLDAGLGAKLIASDGELRALLGVSVYPRKLPANLGGAFEAHLGTGGSFTDGRWLRGMFALPLRASLVLGSGSAIEIGAGPSLSILTLDGNIMGFPVHVVHVDPGLRASVAFELRSRSFAIALVAAADVQEKVLYKAGDATVLEVSPFGVSFILRVRLGLF